MSRSLETFCLLVVCVKASLRVSVAVLLHVLYGCETRFLYKIGHVYSGGRRRRHSVKFGVRRVLGNVKEWNEEGEKIT